MAQERTPLSQQDTQKAAVLRKALVAEGISDKTASKLAKTLPLLAKGISDKTASDLAKTLASALNAAPKEDLHKQGYIAEPPAVYAINAGHKEIPILRSHATNKAATKQKAPSTEAPSTNKIATRQQEPPTLEARLIDRIVATEIRLIDRISESEARLIDRIVASEIRLIDRISELEARLNKKIDDGLEKIGKAHKQQIRWLIGIGIAVAALIISSCSG